MARAAAKKVPMRSKKAGKKTDKKEDKKEEDKEGKKPTTKKEKELAAKYPPKDQPVIPTLSKFKRLGNFLFASSRTKI